MKYTDLIFDLYGTLVDIHTDETDTVWQECASFFAPYGLNISGDELKKRFQDEIKLRESKEGQNYECYPDIPFDEVLTVLLKREGVEIAQSIVEDGAWRFRQKSTEYIRLYPYMREALERLRELGCRLWLLSNAQRVFTTGELEMLGIYDLFDGVYLSSNYGCRKPDKRFYESLICDHNLDVKRCVMIGNDRDTDIAGAKALGMATLYMHTALTPAEQSKADGRLHPVRAEGIHFEYEGADWKDLAPLIEKICK
jgi:putative hydrolase of the HAD superfamily